MGILGYPWDGMDGDEHPFAGRFGAWCDLLVSPQKRDVQNVGLFWGLTHGFGYASAGFLLEEASAGQLQQQRTWATVLVPEVCGWFDVADQLSA